ncbi:g protein-coupled receptor [Anaeramoeba flamelloides]|uniref:G protein-coupled receptor n=1 Tax=Anaeramoeba flamelloides TaxID=1746091 RepID=A0AAV8A4X9_9EUKA|nr:g protein-coupled receptor [Anaeramoeba flamelloides]
MSTLSVVSLCIASLSLLGCCLIIILNIRFKSYRSHFFRRLILVLTIYDFFHATTFFMSVENTGKICTLQGIYLTLIGLCPPYMSFIISILTFLKIDRNYSDFKLKKIFLYLHLVGIIQAFGFTFLAVYFGKIDQTPGTNWCFIASTKWIFVYYCVLWVDLIGSFIAYGLSVKVITRSLKELKQYKDSNYTLFDSETKKKELRLQLRMMAIPLSLFFTIIFSSIKRIRYFLEPTAKPIYSIDVLQAISNPSQGLLDCIVFVFLSKYSREKLKLLLKCKSENVKTLKHSTVSVQSNQEESFMVIQISGEDSNESLLSETSN